MRHRRAKRPKVVIEQVLEPERPAEPDLTARIFEACAGRTPAEIAAMTDTDFPDVVKYLEGTEPPVEFLTRLCRALGVRVSWMIMGDEPMLAADYTAHLLKTATYEQLDAAVRQAIARGGPPVGPETRP